MGKYFIIFFMRSILSLLVKALYFHNKFQLQEIHKEVPRWTSKLRNYKFDVIACMLKNELLTYR